MSKGAGLSASSPQGRLHFPGTAPSLDFAAKEETGKRARRAKSEFQRKERHIIA